METPPPPPDLEEVYRPFEDPGLKNVEELRQEPADLGELRDLLGMASAPESRPESQLINLSKDKELRPAAPQDHQAAREAVQRIPQSAKGFGSDDLFGAPKEDSMFEAMCRMLPEQVTQRVDCLAVSTKNDVQEVEAQPLDPVSAEHAATAANRSMEGRWVPTYMRQQLAAGGHTSLPSAPNGHEHSASAQPPSCGQAFVEMGQDFSGGARAMLEFMAAFFTSLTFQCQACSQQAMSTAHEQVMGLGDDWCGYADVEEVSSEPWPLPPQEASCHSRGPHLEPSWHRGEAQGVVEDLRADELKPCAVAPSNEGRVDKDLLMQVASAM